MLLLPSGYIQFIHKPQGSICVEPLYTTMLTCDVMATPNARISWWKGHRKISKANHHYLMLHNITGNAVSSILLIYDTSTTDNGWYTCLASNSAVSRRIHVFVKVIQCGMLLSPCHSLCMLCNAYCCHYLLTYAHYHLCY